VRSPLGHSPDQNSIQERNSLFKANEEDNDVEILENIEILPHQIEVDRSSDQEILEKVQDEELYLFEECSTPRGGGWEDQEPNSGAVEGPRP
jgi:hypothetical protein